MATKKAISAGTGRRKTATARVNLIEGKGKWTVNEGVVLEAFDGLRADICALALGCYIAECLDALSVEDQPDAPLMQLGLNSLYALSRGMYSHAQIKAAFELRLMCLAGYAPELGGCAVCGAKEPEEPVLSLETGCLCCRRCRTAQSGRTAALCPESLAAMRYIISAPAKQLFSFTLGGAALARLGSGAEDYLLCQTERRFSTLDYYKSMRI